MIHIWEATVTEGLNNSRNSALSTHSGGSSRAWQIEPRSHGKFPGMTTWEGDSHPFLTSVEFYEANSVYDTTQAAQNSIGMLMQGVTGFIQEDLNHVPITDRDTPAYIGVFR
jgi:hypothetical protein